MEQNHIHSHAPSADARAFPSSDGVARDAGEPPAATAGPRFAPSLLSDDLNDTFPLPEYRRRERHDGWTPDKIAGFIEALCACGVVADACRAVRMSPQSAYALRNRRAGRAFAVAWEAALVHRGRGRLADEVMGRAINGCRELTRDKDGEVAGERHRYDNRLSMAVLTRLDRLAEREGADPDLLRAVSEDMDDYLELVETGGDVDGFVDARRAPPPAPEPAPDPGPGQDAKPAIENEWDRMADLLGCLDYKTANPIDIDIGDLPGTDITRYRPDQMMRAHYSGYLAWLECVEDDRERTEAMDGDPEADAEWFELDKLDTSPRAFMVARSAAVAGADPDEGDDGPDDEPEDAPDPAPQPSSSST